MLLASPFFNYRRLLIAVSLSLIFARAPVTANDMTLTENVQRSLQSNSAGLKVLAITWQRTRSTGQPSSDVLKALGYQATALDVLAPNKVRFIWQDGKFYVYFWRKVPQYDLNRNLHPEQPLIDQEQECAFDGAVFYNGARHAESHRGSAGTPVLRIDKLSQILERAPEENLIQFENNYLLHAGYHISLSPKALNGKEGLESLLARALEKGAKVLTVTNTATNGTGDATVDISLADGGKQRYTLDAGQGYIQRRRVEWFPSGVVKLEVECSDFVRPTAGLVSLPKRITAVHFSDSGTDRRPLFSETFTAAEITAERFPDSQFVIKYSKPGSMISDAAMPEA